MNLNPRLFSKKKVLILGDSFASGVNNRLPLNGKISLWFVFSRLLLGFSVYLPLACILGILISPRVGTLLALKNEHIRRMKWFRQYLLWHFNQFALSKSSVNCFTDLVARLKEIYDGNISITSDVGIYKMIVGLTQEKLDRYFSRASFDYILIFLGVNDIGQCVSDDEIASSISRLAATIKRECPDALVAYVKQPNIHYHMTSDRMLRESFITLPFNFRLSPAQCSEFFGGLNNSPIFKRHGSDGLKKAADAKIRSTDNCFDTVFSQFGLRFFSIESYVDNPDGYFGYSDLFAFDCLHPNERGYHELYGKNSLASFERFLASDGKQSNKYSFRS